MEEIKPIPMQGVSPLRELYALWWYDQVMTRTWSGRNMERWTDDDLRMYGVRCFHSASDAMGKDKGLLNLALFFATANGTDREQEVGRIIYEGFTAAQEVSRPPQPQPSAQESEP